MTRPRKKRPPEIYEHLPAHLVGCAQEQALCYDFIEEAELAGWKVIPEYPDSSFDLFLVAQEGVTTAGAKPGMQVGVQAKTHANLELLGQMMSCSDRTASWKKRWPGPDYIVALVPGRSRTDTEVVVERAIKRLGLGFFFVYEYFVDHFSGQNLKRKNLENMKFFGQHTGFPKRVALPEVDQWTEPGVASPTYISSSLIQAIKFVFKLERTPMSYLDFQGHGQSITTWINAGWVEVAGQDPTAKRRRLLYKLKDADPGMVMTRPDYRNPELTMKLRRKHEKEGELPKDSDGPISDTADG